MVNMFHFNWFFLLEQISGELLGDLWLFFSIMMDFGNLVLWCFATGSVLKKKNRLSPVQRFLKEKLSIREHKSDTTDFHSNCLPYIDKKMFYKCFKS